MPFSGLTDPFLKTSRAKVHLDNLVKEVQAFYETKPYSITGEEDLEQQRYIIRTKLIDMPDPVPLIAGDFLYCVRASLDQLVWSLAKLTVPYPEGTQFPILDKIPNAEGRRRFQKQTAGVPPDAVKIIEELQPYKRGDSAAIASHLLWRLNLLGNIDKHRRIPVHGVGLTVRFPDMPPYILDVARREDNDTAISFPIAFKDKLNFNPQATFSVVFGDFFEGIQSDIDGLSRIYDFVTNSVIPRFSRFFQ